MMRVDSYSPVAPRPEVGTLWVWEPELPHARALVRVTEVKWNGEEWWVETESLLDNTIYPSRQAKVWNDLSRFYEACREVAAA